MSHLELIKIGVRGHLASVARQSQCSRRMFALASLLATGCIVPDAPEYGSPSETPIFVRQATISPDPRSIYHLTNAPGNVLQVSFQVQSEDLSYDGIVSAIYVDYKHQNGHIIEHNGPLTPYTFDQLRTISWRINLPALQLGQPNDPPSCHIITVIVLHQKGWDAMNSEQIGSPTDLAAVSWIADVNDPDGLVPLSSCPDISTTNDTVQ